MIISDKTPVSEQIIAEAWDRAKAKGCTILDVTETIPVALEAIHELADYTEGWSKNAQKATNDYTQETCAQKAEGCLGDLMAVAGFLVNMIKSHQPPMSADIPLEIISQIIRAYNDVSRARDPRNMTSDHNLNGQ